MRWFASDHWSLRIDPSGPGRPVRSRALSERYAVQRSACSWLHSRATASRCVAVAPRSATSATSLFTWTSSRATSAKPSVPRSCRSVVMATSQPPPISPMTFSTGTSTPLRKISLNSGSPVICVSGRTSTPGACMSTIRYVRPACRCGVGVGSRDEDAEVGDVRVRRPDLLPVEHEAVAVAARGGADAGEVRAGVRLREPLAPDLVGRQQRLEVARLLLLGPAADDRRPRHPEADHPDVRRRLGPRLLLEVDRLEAGRQPPAAVLRRPRDPDPAAVVERAAPPADLGPVEASAAAAVAAKLVREVLVEPGAHLPAEGCLLRRVAEVHAAMLNESAPVEATSRSRRAS